MKTTLRILLAALLIALTALAFAEGEATLALPSGLKTVSDEAFCGNAAIRKVMVPEGAEQIGSRAFADSGLTEIVLPATVGFIAEDAFDGCGALKVVAEEGSYAYEWCVSHGIAVETPYVTPAEHFTYAELDDGTLSITKYTGADAVVIVPSKIDGKTVTEIGYQAFSGT